MSATVIWWEDQPFALLIETPEARYLVPPLVLDEHGNPVEGRELLAAVIDTGVTIELPVVSGATPAVLAEIDQRMARISEELGVPVASALAREEER